MLAHRPLSPETPAETLCVIEAAESSLATNLGLKLRLYAAAHIATYIVLDLAARTIRRIGGTGAVVHPLNEDDVLHG